MFVYIVGNVEQNIFRIGTAKDPIKHLPIIQAGNPYQLSMIAQVCLKNKNAASLVESLSRQDLREYEGAGEWITSLPEGLLAQLVSGRYLRAIADEAGVTILDQKKRTASNNSDDLRRLLPIVKRKDLDFRDVVDSVDKAYSNGVPIDEII